jgi:hypothetical protein
VIYANESPTEIHHEDCTDTPDSWHTGDATEGFVLDPGAHADGAEEFDRSCSCLDPVLGRDA